MSDLSCRRHWSFGLSSPKHLAEQGVVVKIGILGNEVKLTGGYALNSPSSSSFLSPKKKNLKLSYFRDITMNGCCMVQSLPLPKHRIIVHSPEWLHSELDWVVNSGRKESFKVIFSVLRYTVLLPSLR